MFKKTTDSNVRHDWEVSIYEILFPFLIIISIPIALLLFFISDYDIKTNTKTKNYVIKLIKPDGEVYTEYRVESNNKPRLISNNGCLMLTGCRRELIAPAGWLLKVDINDVVEK